MENISRLLGEHALSTVQKTNLLMLDVLGDVLPGDMRLPRGSNSMRAKKLHASLESHSNTAPGLISALHLTNAKGEHIHSSLASLPHIDISDRYHFQRQRDDPNAGLVISPPLVARTTGKWTLILTRRINFEDGSFAGTLTAILDPEYFQKFYRTLDMGKHGAVSLFDMELRLVARYPQSEKDMGKPANLYAKTYIDKGVNQATYQTKSPLDGVERTYSFRQVDSQPLFVFAGTSADDYLAAWRQHVLEYGIGFLILGFVLAGFGLRQRQAEESLRKLSLAVEQSPNSIVITDLDANIEFVNASFIRTTGYSFKEAIGKNPRLLHSGKTPQSTYDEMWACLSRGEPWKGEFINRCKDGSEYIELARIAPVRQADGRISHFLAVKEDITERKRSEEMLRKSTEELEDLYNHAPCGYHSLDKDGVFVRINDTELEWLGYARDEVIGKVKLPDLLTPASRENFRKAFPVFKMRGVLQDFELDLVRKDGSIMSGLANATLMRDADGEYLISRSTLFDITERKKTEDTLRSLFTAIEHSPIGVLITDAEANIQYVSPRFSAITGYKSADLIRRNLRLLQMGQIPKNTYLDIWNTLTGGQSWHGELVNKNKRGKVYWEDVHIAPVATPEGNVANYAVVIADISERKEAEEKMQHLARYDQLTDLPNRSMVEDRLQQALATAKRDKTQMALMFIDLDKFKPINDTLGHDVGDMVLKEAAKRMQGCVRESDTVGRIGGDEFVVLLTTVDSDQHAALVAEKIRHALNQPIALFGQDLHISSSIGVAIYPEHGADGKTLVKNADAAMYYAKEAGRNSVRLFDLVMLESGE